MILAQVHNNLHKNLLKDQENRKILKSKWQEADQKRVHNFSNQISEMLKLPKLTYQEIEDIRLQCYKEPNYTKEFTLRVAERMFKKT